MRGLIAVLLLAAGCSSSIANGKLTQEKDGTYILRGVSEEEARLEALRICAKTDEKPIFMNGLGGKRFLDVHCWRCFGPDAGWTYWRDCP
jgi:hypothetical protein